MSRSSLGMIHAAVGCERLYQDYKWGSIDDHPHDVGGWITIMRKELREAEDAWCSEDGHYGALAEILQVISVGVACLEQHGVVTREDLNRLKQERREGVK